MAANSDTLDSIHILLASSMEQRLKDIEAGAEPLSAAEIAAYSKFLKDNGVTIDLPSSAQDTPGRSLIKSIPFPSAANQTTRIN